MTVDWIKLNEAAKMVYDAVGQDAGGRQPAVRQTLFMDRPNFVRNRQELISLFLILEESWNVVQLRGGGSAISNVSIVTIEAPKFQLSLEVNAQQLSLEVDAQLLPWMSMYFCPCVLMRICPWISTCICPWMLMHNCPCKLMHNTCPWMLMHICHWMLMYSMPLDVNAQLSLDVNVQHLSLDFNAQQLSM
jgi:hypothetical protein